jgi:WhiB family transcriptional regulator, redox-sensing transcriptional regulator
MIDISRINLSRGLPQEFVPPKVSFNENEWRRKAGCNDVDMSRFYSPHGQHWKQTEKQAQEVVDEVCLYCPVMMECGRYAIESFQLDGIWGGMTPNELTKKVKYHFAELALEQGIDPHNK